MPTRPPRFNAQEGLNVNTYDARTTEQDRPVPFADIEFYRRLAQRTGGPVLDLGGGTGRVAWALAQYGFDVVNVDLSLPMLARAEAKRARFPGPVASRVRLVHDDMRSFTVRTTFPLAIIPFRSFQALLDADSQRSCLRAIHTHLRPGGLLAFHVFDPRLDLMVPERRAPPVSDRGTVRHPVTGRSVSIRVLGRRNDPLSQVMEEEWEFRELDDSGRVLRTEIELLAMRWTYRYEMHHLLELSGFVIDAQFGDFAVGRRPTLPSRSGSLDVRERNASQIRIGPPPSPGPWRPLPQRPVTRRRCREVPRPLPPFSPPVTRIPGVAASHPPDTSWMTLNRSCGRDVPPACSWATLRRVDHT